MTPEPTDESRINSILDQMQQVKVGIINSITCGFCGGENRRGAASLAVDEWARPGVSPFCCDSFAEVARAISGMNEGPREMADG